jgi:hypothetical protein
MRRAILKFLALDRLTRSIANRIFDNSPTAAQFNWCGRHRDALSLMAIEHPALLPFLRWVEFDGRSLDADPETALSALLAMEGIDPAAGKRLERWGYEPFARFEEDWTGDRSICGIIGFANLLARLGLNEPPPAFFSHCVGAAISWFYGRDPDFGSRIPDWFMRAMLNAIESMEDEEDEIGFGEEVLAAMPWIAARPPPPDSNQCKAGWPWIMERVREFELRRAKAEWPVPLEEAVIRGYQVVPIGSLAQLRAEAQEMKNCLVNYAEPCGAGAMAIFSIRKPGATGPRRVANASAVRTRVRDRVTWSLHQVAGKANSEVSGEIEQVAEEIVRALNTRQPASHLL